MIYSMCVNLVHNLIFPSHAQGANNVIIIN